MTTDGRHLLVEYTGCNPEILNSKQRVSELMMSAAIAAQTTVVASVFREFNPQGVTGVVVIEESHLSIHTWPEYSYAAVDFFTCGNGVPALAHEVLFAGLEAQHAETLLINRGTGPRHEISLGAHEKQERALDATAPEYVQRFFTTSVA